MPENFPRCLSCRHYFPDEEILTGNGKKILQSKGYCQRFPPSNDGFPMVDALICHCGEFSKFQPAKKSCG